MRVSGLEPGVVFMAWAENHKPVAKAVPFWRSPVFPLKGVPFDKTEEQPRLEVCIGNAGAGFIPAALAARIISFTCRKQLAFWVLR